MFRVAFLAIIRISEPYVGFGTLYAVVVTVYYREYNGTTPYNIIKPTYVSELLMMGRSAARNM
jgi:hypothetical protein